MCEADSSANHAHLFPPHKGTPPAANPKERYPIRRRIWQHALGRRSGRTAQLLACWDADGVRGRKYELGHFLNQHGVNNYLLNITLIQNNPFGLSIVFHRTGRLTVRDGTAILVRRGILYHSGPAPGLTLMEATAIQVMLAGKPVRNLAGTFRLPTHSSERTCAPFSAEGCRTCCPAT